MKIEESFFRAQRIKGKRSRGGKGKSTVLGIFQRNCKVDSEIVPHWTKAMLSVIVRG